MIAETSFGITLVMALIDDPDGPVVVVEPDRAICDAVDEHGSHGSGVDDGMGQAEIGQERTSSISEAAS